ncbi:MAG TPA: hypothetical protein DEQ09_09665 [Bacteroidales bacterium]|nr:hypothetical protein [Bacteroidales bacterium]
MSPKINLIFFVYSFVLLAPAMPQDDVDNKATEILFEYFDNIYGDDERLVSGHIYTGPARGSIKGHPYYFNDKWKEGSVKTSNAVFNGLKIKYDIYINHVILEYTSKDNSVRQVGLNTGNIVSVNIAGAEFIPLPEINNPFDLYLAEVICQGMVQYMVAKRKKLEISNTSGSYDYEYKKYVKQYLYYDGSLIPYRGKRTLYKIFPDKKRLIRKFNNKNSYKKSGNRIEDSKRLIDYFNTLLSVSDD